jgi:hypothetical protein
MYRVFDLKRNPNYTDICKFWWHRYNKTNELFFSFYLAGKKLQNSFTAHAENVHHLLKDKHLPSSVCFVRLCEAFLRQCWQQSVLNWSPSFMGCSKKLILWEIPTESSLAEQDLEIAVAKGHAQQRAHQRTLALKQLFSQCGPSLHHVKAERLTGQHCPTPDMFPVVNTSCVPKFCYQSVHCCLIRYFLVRIRTAKCFTNNSKRFRCEVMFENEHTFCSWIHHVRTRTAFAKVWAAA